MKQARPAWECEPQVTKGQYTVRDNTGTILERMSTDVQDWKARHKAVHERLHKRPCCAIPLRIRCLTTAEMWCGVSPTYAQEIKADEHIPAKAIIAAVAKCHLIAVGDLCGPRRYMPFMPPRAHAAFLLKEWRPDLSYPQIGRFLGNRDHSTVMNLINVVWPKHRERFEHLNAEIRLAAHGGALAIREA